MGVKVKRDRPSRRLHHRVTAPLYATVDGHVARAADWSLGGLRIENFAGTVPGVGDIIDLHISLPFQGFQVAFDTRGEIVRNDIAGGMFALKFLELGEREAELMQHFVEEIVRGTMVDVEDTIQRIDVPVTPVSTKPDPNPIAEIPKRRLPVKTVVMSTFYMALGFVVFGYFGVMLYANYFRMEVRTAVISAPLESVKAQFDGRIVWTDHRAGQRVKAGDILLYVADNELEKEIDFARIEVEERRANLAFLRRKQADELHRMEGLADVTLKNVRQRKLEIDALEVEVKAAESQASRLGSLLAQGFTTRQRVEEAEAAWVDAKKRLASRRLELKSQSRLAKSYIGKRHFTGQNFVGEVGRIGAEVELAERRIGIASTKLDVLLKHRARLAVRSPFDGVLLDLPRVDMASVRHGETVAIVEQRRRRDVLAYLQQDEVLQVGVGDRAYGFIPALNESVPLIVREIDRTSGFVDENLSNYRFRGVRDRSARVRLDFEYPELMRDVQRYRSGLPMIVLFQQQSTNQVLSEINRRLKMVAIAVFGSKGPVVGTFKPNENVERELKRGAATGGSVTVPQPLGDRTPSRQGSGAHRGQFDPLFGDGFDELLSRSRQRANAMLERISYTGTSWMAALRSQVREMLEPGSNAYRPQSVPHRQPTVRPADNALTASRASGVTPLRRQ
ncbi:MAG: PilZ domain-containing protein [Pseudomonadota bacterium]